MVRGGKGGPGRGRVARGIKAVQGEMMQRDDGLIRQVIGEV